MNELPTHIKTGDETAVQLAPFGTYPQRDETTGRTVEQLLDAQAAERLVRAFDAEVLVDADHESEKGSRTEAYGWIVALRAEAESGLWGTIRWTDKGAEAVAARRYRFVSPAWTVDATGRPEKLRSLALTNRPNIPARPILNVANVEMLPMANSNGQLGTVQLETGNIGNNGNISQTPNPKGTPAMDEIKAALGLAADATDADVLAAVEALKADVAAEKEKQLNAEADAFAEEHKDKVADKAALANAYKKDPELAKAILLNCKAPAAPAKAPAAPPVAERLLLNRAPLGADPERATLTRESARERLASLPPAERAAYYQKNADLIG